MMTEDPEKKKLANDKKHAKERALMGRHREWKQHKGIGNLRIKKTP